MLYYHVIARTNSGGKFLCLFSDLAADDLKKQFIEPYERGKSFFSGNDLFSPSDLRTVQIVATRRTEQIERDESNRMDRERIDELNRTSKHAVVISLGGGYEPEDIAQAGDDVTRIFIKGPPGFKASKGSSSAKVFRWVAGVIAAVLAAGIAKWLKWV